MRSEAENRRLWRQRWRACVRDQLGAPGPVCSPQPLDRRAVANPWTMDKDGKRWIEPWRLR